MAKELRHPQVTQEQIDLWLAQPVSKVFLSCLEFKRLDIRDAAGDGTLVDSSNADLTHAVIHHALGQQAMLAEAADPRRLMEFYEMVFIPEEPDAKPE